MKQYAIILTALFALLCSCNRVKTTEVRLTSEAGDKYALKEAITFRKGQSPMPLFTIHTDDVMAEAIRRICRDPDDYLQFKFKDDAFAALLKRHCEAIAEASKTTVELKAEAAGRVNQTGSIMTVSKPLVADGNDFKYNVILSHLYYKNTAAEDIDLAIQLGTEKKYHIEPDSPVTFILENGSEITLPQTRDEVNFLYVYPSLAQLRTLAYGHVTTIRIQTEDGTLSDAILENSFSEAVNQQYQLLMSLSEK